MPYNSGGQLLVGIETDPVYQLLSEIIENIPTIIRERMDELDTLSFPASESTREYEYESTTDIVSGKVRKWQEALLDRVNLSELGKNSHDDIINWDTQTLYSLLLKASELSDSKREDFIRELILTVPQWLGGKIYWESLNAIYEEVLSPSSEPIRIVNIGTLRDEDIPF